MSSPDEIPDLRATHYGRELRDLPPDLFDIDAVTLGCGCRLEVTEEFGTRLYARSDCTDHGLKPPPAVGYSIAWSLTPEPPITTHPHWARSVRWSCGRL